MHANSMESVTFVNQIIAIPLAESGLFNGLWRKKNSPSTELA
jgi:hypothetical protein